MKITKERMLLSSFLLLCLLAPSLQVTVGNLQIRLVGGSSTSQGRVEVRRFNNETWGTVCGNFWDERDAAVVCRQINPAYTWGKPSRYAFYGQGTGRIYLSNTMCQGNETNLGQCQSSRWASPHSYCGHWRDAGISCFTNKVRLRPQRGNTQGAIYGAVEVLNENTYKWMAVCDSNWDDNDARVVCKSAGFTDGKAQCCGKLTRGNYYSTRGSASGITCTGSEPSFDTCTYTYSSSRCPSSTGLASVICYSQSRDTVNNNFEIRLTNGTSNWGRVEVKHMGVWGTVCAGNSWNDSAASVACKGITGSGGGGIRFGISRSDWFQGSTWVTNLNCNGQESSLDRCVVTPWGSANIALSCRYRTQYALCYTRSAPVVNLVGGSDPSHGRVEITMDGNTYTVCDDNWSTADARVVCRNRGYRGGQPIKGSHYGKGTGQVGLNGLLCNGREDNLLQCRSYGWKVSTSACDGHTKDASVYCHGEVRLIRGDHSTGILQVSTGGYYRTICGTGFTDVEASVACKDLGFQHGHVLPEGSYGRLYSTYGRKLNCTGNESSVYDCTIQNMRCSSNQYSNYAAVHCFNGSHVTTSSVSLVGGLGQYTNSSGHIRLYQEGMRARICSSFWDDNDAKVSCRQMGYSNGLAYGLSSQISGPFLKSEINCEGTETSLNNCPMGNATCTSVRAMAPDAGAFCFNDAAPQVQLVDGANSMEGRVQIVYGSSSGTVCPYYRTGAAKVVCRSLGYVTGSSKTAPAGTGQVALSNVGCRGVENSLFACRNTGFLATPSSYCASHRNDLGVVCYNEVRLIQITQQTNDSIAGIVQFYRGDRWNYVCGNFFDNNEARVICRQLGYNYFQALRNGLQGWKYIYSRYVVSGVNCTGTESAFSSCPMALGNCPNRNRNYASVICSKVPIPTGVQAVQPTSQPGMVIVKADGIHSSVCYRQWNDNSAKVYCRTLGYDSGRVFGSIYDRSLPQLVANITCSGRETSISDCQVSTALAANTCYSRGARVLCFMNREDVQVRLVGGQVRHEGNVEVNVNGQWGSVCDASQSAADANVACRSVGFSGGSNVPVGTFGNAATPTLIMSPRCTGSEGSIVSCPMLAYNNSDLAVRYSCSRRVLAVRCSGEVRLTPGSTYGGLQVLTNSATSTYRSVCSDGFGAQEATVACRDLGFPHGLAVCCSAFGQRYYFPSIAVNNMHCTGRESSLKECSSTNSSLTRCTSNQYASVICSNLSPSTGYTVGVDFVPNYKFGRAKVKYMGYWGYFCSNGFTSKDANVICKEAGYVGGISYSQYHHPGYGQSRDINWLKDVSCDGTESYLSMCDNVVWGNSTGCFRNTKAAVFCYENSAPELRLVNGTNLMGRLEIWADGTHSAVCRQYWDDREAVAACRGMGFQGGRALGPDYFGRGTGETLVDYTYCNGRESSLFDCFILLKGTHPYAQCRSHNNDAAVQCYNTTRVTGSNLPNYGRVEVLTGQTWVAVCDTGFDSNAARVACRAVGYTEARYQCCSALGPLGRRYSFSASTIGAVINRCDGSEDSLLNCDISLNSTCSSGKYVSVLCSNSPIQEQPLQTQLVGGSYRGEVHVNRYGVWGPVCKTNWDDEDANATCHGLGYQYGVSYYAKDNTGQPRLIGNVQCTGQEARLADCTFGGIDDPVNCSLPRNTYYRRDAGVLCYNTPGIGLRLVDGGSQYGRLEAQFNGEWGRVADYHWTSTDSSVACKQLGFKSGRTLPWSARSYHPNRFSKIWLNFVGCTGKERTLFECYNYFDYHSTIAYYYTDDANVLCNNNVRLSRGNYYSSGVVEVNINDKWGSVCDNEWTSMNTEVTCKNLGYDNGFHLCCGVYGRTQLPMMESVSCSASDTELTSCSHEVPGRYSCDSNSVSVACYKGARPTAYTYGLHTGYADNNTGEVALEFMNITGKICSDGWDDMDAKVFCSELGFPHGQAYEHIHYYTNEPYWSTNVNCHGTETRLRDCGLTLGQVSNCRSGRSAGVLCTNSEGVFYDMVGGNSAFKGRVQVSVDGVWGTICRTGGFGDREANVFCRSQGYNDGRVDYSGASYANPPSKIYQTRINCQGDETSLNDCPHTGWKTATSSFCTHSRDVKVICFSDVRLGNAYNPLIRQGPVQFYQNSSWYNLCDENFDDVEAKLVCKDLEFDDGKAVVGSAYGSKSYYGSWYSTHLNYTMECEGQEQISSQCIKPGVCTSETYASAVCFSENDYVDESTYSYDFTDSSKQSGIIQVTHMNITGFVCSNAWEDVDAKVLCRSKGHLDGLAYRYNQQSWYSYFREGPFWVSNVTCSGSETKLEDCPFVDRLHLGNCDTAALAGAVCFNDSGIQYRLAAAGFKPNEGRVEVSLGGQWGTVCRYNWGDMDARVFCRDQGYTDGYAIRNTFGTTGSGPMWMSNLLCKGTESSLHQCAHGGFSDEPIDDDTWGWGCRNHYNDAYVSCIVGTVKLNLGYKASMGAVMVYRQNAWNLICDSGLNMLGATVVCRQYDYNYGVAIPGSSFGLVDNAQIGINNVRCVGTESNITKCPYDVSSACSSNQYASVICSHSPIQEEAQNVRLVRDDPNDSRHGYLEYQKNGVWGAVCKQTADPNTVNVACKQLGFTGGKLYAPSTSNYKQPILTSNLKCKGTESRLDDCPQTTVPSSAWCDYYAPRAGVLCYNDTDGISYRIIGDAAVSSRGRFEMKYMGQFGSLCTYSNNQRSARVACRSVGYQDGLAIQGRRYISQANEPVWFFQTSCQGNESSVIECTSAGFKSVRRYMQSLCRNSIGPLSVQCYQTQIRITQVRLANGPTNSSGRVEVFLEGPNKWGTVCDDDWDDVDATVVCNQLGYATGTAVSRAGFGKGTGGIYMDNVGCKGMETRLQDCGFNGVLIHNCGHSEDAGAVCSGVYVPPTTPSPTRKGASTSKPSGKPSTGPSKKPTVQKQTGSSGNTAAIVAPIVVIIVLGVAAGLGFILYRRRFKDNNVQLLEGNGQSGALSFSREGVVKFVNRVRGRGQKENDDTTMGGLSNPSYSNQNISNPNYDNVAGVFATDHADFTDA